MKISIVAAISQNMVIGNKGKLPWYLKADLELFRTITYGQTVVMGYKTFQSLRFSPLKGRTNIVVSKYSALSVPGVIYINNLKDLENLNIPSIYIIGGYSLYKTTIQDADSAHITHVHANVTGDTYFTFDPKLWSLKPKFSMKYEKDKENEHSFTYCYYER